MPDSGEGRLKEGQGRRGRAVRELLARNELPGEIKVVLGFAGFFGGYSALILAFVAVVGEPADLAVVAVVHVPHALIMAAVFLGLLMRRRFAWWLAAGTFGLLTVATIALGAVLITMQATGRLAQDTFAGSGLAVFGILVGILLYGTPLVLLIFSKRRYFEVIARP